LFFFEGVLSLGDIFVDLFFGLEDGLGEGLDGVEKLP
jgi:hypothetical protein